jgi:hypothetical protein
LSNEVEIRVGFEFSGDGDSVLLSFRSGWWGGVVLPPLSGDRWFLLSVGVGGVGLSARTSAAPMRPYARRRARATDVRADDRSGPLVVAVVAV